MKTPQVVEAAYAEMLRPNSRSDETSAEWRSWYREMIVGRREPGKGFAKYIETDREKLVTLERQCKLRGKFNAARELEVLAIQLGQIADFVLAAGVYDARDPAYLAQRKIMARAAALAQ